MYLKMSFPLLRAMNFEEGYEMYKDTKDLLFKAPAPGVAVHCLHGVNVPTIERYLPICLMYCSL